MTPLAAWRNRQAAGGWILLCRWDRPQRDRFLVFNVNAAARDDRVGEGLAVRDLEAGELFELLIAGLEDDQLHARSQSHQDRASVHDGPITGGAAHAAASPLGSAGGRSSRSRLSCRSRPHRL